MPGAGGGNQRFQGQRQARSEARLAESLQQIPDDIAAGRSYHQVASLDSGPIRTRSSKAPVSEGPLWNNDGNAFGPKVATILHSQMVARGMEGAEVVHPVELSRMGHQKLDEKRMDAPLVAVRAGSLGLTTDPAVVSGVVVRPSSSYDLLHVDTQTSLRAVPKRLMDGRNADERDAIYNTVQQLVRGSGVQLKTHGGERISVTSGSSGPQVAHPGREKFGTAAEYATSVVRAVSTAIARSDDLSRHVQDEELGRRAVASARRKERRQIPAGGTRYAEVHSDALAQISNRAVKALAARENVYLATDQPREAAEFDKQTRTFHPERKPLREPYPAPDTREQVFGEKMLLDLAGEVGTPDERKAAKAGHSLEVARLAGVQIPGLNPRPDGLGAGQERARTSMVADLAARTTLERLGIEYAPAPPAEQMRKDQSTYARTPGALDQAWREAASVRAHLVSRDWEHERKPEMLEHSARSTFEAPARARDAKAQERAVPDRAAPGGAGPGAGDSPAEPPR